MPRLQRLSLVAFLALVSVDCGKKESGPGGPGPEVVVATVEKRDVEIYSEWVGTTTGYVNAQIYPKVQGYLLKQAYRDGSVVKEGDLLFEIDPRQFQATLDEAHRPARDARAPRSRRTRSTSTRYTPLAAEGAVSQQELDNAVQARAASTARGRLGARQRRAGAAQSPVDAGEVAHHRSRRRSPARRSAIS